MQGEASTRLGFTDYFRVELAWAKLLGAVLLLAPVPARLKEWAYAAFAITLGSALIAHLSIGEGPRRRGAGRRAPGVLWGLSYFCGVASRARASAGPLEDEQRVANQDPKNPAQMKASTGSPLTDVSAEYGFHVDDGRSVQSFEMRFVEHRIADRRIQRLIQKWLKAGVSEAGTWTATDRGTPQGAVASPLLANVYLHYVFDLWVRRWRRRSTTGDMIVVRYADDDVVGFEHRADAERSVVPGWCDYHAVPGNMDSLNVFRLVRRWIPSARISHPQPNVRFDATHPR